MAGYSQAERDKIISIFPDLADDEHFEVTSDEDALYNCIGFALGFNDIWVALGRPDDIPWYWWPKEVPFDRTPESLIKTFEYFGFNKCDALDSGDYIKGYDKVALYQYNGQWTHAARVIGNQLLHSKLGLTHDIHHSPGLFLFRANPQEASYGTIYQYMIRKQADSHISKDKKPSPSGKMWYHCRLVYAMIPPI